MTPRACRYSAAREIASVRAVGNLSKLREAVAQGSGGADPHESDTPVAVAVAEQPASSGIGHTRWATHGRVTESNAHPHFDTNDRVHVVVNGIVENYLGLKQRMTDMGADYTSETDAEVIAHLISHHMALGSLTEAVCAAYNELEGHYAFVAMSADEPGTLVGARKECPLIVGRGDGEQFLGSAVPAFLAHTRDVQFIENGEIVVLRADGVQFLTPDGTPLEREITHVDWDEATAEKGGYETFMLKEIHEQADAVAETVADRTARGDGVDLAEAELDESLLHGRRPDPHPRRRHLVSRRPDRPLRDRGVGADPGRDGHRLGVALPQPDRLRARAHHRHHAIGRDRRHAGGDAPGAAVRGEGARLHERRRLAGDARRRRRALHARRPRGVGGGDEDVRLPGRSDVPAGAAPRRAARHDARRSGSPSSSARSSGCRTASPSSSIRLDAPVKAAAERHADSEFYLYLGRHVGRAVALEGALKLKEISYIATDAYAGGEMKHGPIALLDESTPVVCVATDMPILDKMISNIQEVRARGAHVIAIATEGDERLAPVAEEVIYIPRTDWMLQALLAVIPLQLFAYYVARKRGLNVDQPRNLAKTVTVE